MSAKIDIITVGYAQTADAYQSDRLDGGKYMRATGSCCLARSGGHKVLFDTMGPWEKDLLLERLSSLSIHPDDIDHLVCSHSHPDHVGNLNLFTKANRQLVGTSVYSRDIYDLNQFEPTGTTTYQTKRGIEVVVPQYKNFQIDSNLTIKPTQGHTMECISMIVSNCDTFGTVGLVGDLFERQEDVEDDGIWLEAGSQNADLQRANRYLIYNQVEYLMPGHGPLFRTQRSGGFKVIF